ncbi:MAG: DUF3344 domain-containing protein [Methanosarcinales archaeon]|nr:DUF3344 domain-containing protein [Methanosarcinales archaeon]
MTKFKYMLLSILLLTLVQQAGADYKFDGTPIVAVKHDTVSGGIYVDGGHGIGGAPYTQSFSNVPANIVYARLYVGIWGGTPDYTGTVETKVNGQTLGTLNLRGKADTNPNVVCTGYGVYLVTYVVPVSYLKEGSNAAVVTTAGEIDGRVYGVTLAAVHESEGAPEVEYWLNDGHENLNGKNSYDECTTSFAAAKSTNSDASLTVAYICGSPGQKDYLYINDNQIGGDDVADSMGGSAGDFDIKTFDVSNHFDPAGNSLLFKRGDETTVHPFITVLTLSSGGTATPTPSPETKPDLTITEIKVPDRVFAEDDNTIEVVVRNQGDYDVTNAFNLELSVGSIPLGSVRIPDLGAGESETVQFIWNPGETIEYTLRAMVDVNSVIDEADETNNEAVSVVTVGESMGYYGDDSIETFEHDTINGSIVYTLGNSSYVDPHKLKELSGDEECGYVVGYNLTLPFNATVRNARLYVYWTWGTDGSEGKDAQMNVTFGENADISADKKYTDRKGYDPYDYPSGTYCYNVTDYIEDGNGSMVNYTAIMRNIGEGYAKFAIYGANLLVVYEDSKEPEIEYWINEGCDIIYSFDDDDITPEDATTKISFPGVIDLAKVRQGTLITFVTDGTVGGDELRFNTETWDDVYENVSQSITIDERHVTDYLNTSGNYAQIREINEQGMVPSTALLILERGQNVQKLDHVPIAVGEITDMGIHYISDDTYGAVFGTLRFAINDRFDRVAGYREAEDIWVYAVPSACDPDYNVWMNVTETSEPTRTLRIFDDPYTNETQDYETEICYFDENDDGVFDDDNETCIYRTTTSYDGTFALRLDGGMYDIYARY